MKDIQHHDIIPLLIVVGLLVAPAGAAMTQHAVVTTFAGSDTKIGSGLIYPYPGIIWGPYLSGTTSTDTVVNVKTTEPVTVTVEYATEIYYKASASYDQNATDGTTDMLHHVSLTGLEPDTLYYYRVIYDGQATGDLHFRTFPESGPVTFVVYSDTQDQLPTFSQLERHKIVADRIAEEPDIAFVLNSGDLVNNATNLSDWDRYFAAGSMMMANTTVFPALGNHDRYDPYYSAIYGVPEYYSFDCADVHVTVLNSNDWAWPDLPTQSAWLATDLQTEKPFKFVSFHHPIYSSDYKHFGGWENLRLEWEDDFNENGVLAVFNGHVHAYERLVVNDATYFVAGIGGGPSYNLADPRYEASVSSLEYMIGYTRITIDPVARTATAEVIRVADVSSDLKTLTMVYPPNTIFETVVMALPVPPITVESPKGGESWVRGSTQTVAWNYAGTPGSTVMIELLEGMEVNKVITSSISIGSGGSGFYNWTIPYNQTPGSDYRIRITSTSNPAFNGTSNASFSIGPGSPITLLSPNGGEQWKQGSPQTFRWNYTGEPGSSVKFEVIKGSAVRVIAPSTPIGSEGSGSFTFTFPSSAPLGSDYVIRITSITHPLLTDTSDAPFAIVAPIAVVLPNGGEDWQLGSPQTIQWNYIGNPGPLVKIEALKGDVVIAAIPGVSIGSGGSGSFNLTVPLNTAVDDNYRLRVTSTSNPAYTDTSDSSFQISADSGSSITILSPNGGEVWTQGSTLFINWSSFGNPGSTVKIEVVKGSAVLKTLTGIPTSLGSVSILLPYGAPLGDDYRVRITSTSNPAYTNISAAPFTVESAITVVSPNGGEVWQQGSAKTIQWSFCGNPGSAVIIEALRGETVLAVITSSLSTGPGGTGIYNLTVPDSTPLGSDYRIKITSASYPACTDTSDRAFSIVAG